MNANCPYSVPPFHWYWSQMASTGFHHKSEESLAIMNTRRSNQTPRESFESTETDSSHSGLHEPVIKNDLKRLQSVTATWKSKTSSDKNNSSDYHREASGDQKKTLSCPRVTIGHQQTTYDDSVSFKETETSHQNVRYTTEPSVSEYPNTVVSSLEPIRTTCTLENIARDHFGNSCIKSETLIENKRSREKYNSIVENDYQEDVRARRFYLSSVYDVTTDKSTGPGRHPLVSVSGLLSNRIPPIGSPCYKSQDLKYVDTNHKQLNDRDFSSLNSSGNTDENIDTSNTSCNSDTYDTLSSISPGITQISGLKRTRVADDTRFMPNQSTCSDADFDTNKKKLRTSYTPEQVRKLEAILSKTLYPDEVTLERIAQEFGIPQKRIKVWFQNKRARRKRKLPSMHQTYPVVPFYQIPSVGSSVSPYSFVPPASIMPPAPFYSGFPGSISAPMMPTGYPLYLLQQMYQQMSNH